jgi:DNA modification methylase
VAELVWKGKGARAPRGAAPELHVDEVYGASGGWANRLVRGDAAEVLPALARDLAGQVALIYVDPPFDTGGAFDFQARIPGAGDDVPRIPVRAYDDARGLDGWLEWFHGVAVSLRDLLADGGSLYVHLDAHVAHYAKVLLDELLGPRAFQREIIWRIGWVSGFKSRANSWIRNHDTLLFYAKGERPRTFHKEYLPYPPGYVRRDGKPPRGRGHPVEDVWNAGGLDRLDSIQIVSFSGEKVGYPTQKSEALLSRIVRASSDPGDLVLDTFVGSGTTAVVAEKLGRRWVACDQGAAALHATRRRLLRLPEVHPFRVERAGEERPDPGRRLSVRTRVDGRRATLRLAGFGVPEAAVPARTRARVKHWSQWIEGWCVDWDHRGGPLAAGSRTWRGRTEADLPLEASHAYERAGEYAARVRVYDALGGCITRDVPVTIER